MIKRMTQPITLRGIPVRQRSIGIDIDASKIRSALIDVNAEQVEIVVYWNDELGLADLLAKHGHPSTPRLVPFFPSPVG